MDESFKDKRDALIESARCLVSGNEAEQLLRYVRPSSRSYTPVRAVAPLPAFPFGVCLLYLVCKRCASSTQCANSCDGC